MSSVVQIPYAEAVRIKLLFPHTIANVRRPLSYFERVGGIQFEVFPDAESGLGEMIVAIILFSSGHFAAMGARPTTKHRGIELLCASLEIESEVLAEFKRAFPETTDSEIDTWKT